jgi:hypothetical protein
VSKVDDLLARYEDHVALPWTARVAGAQRVWFVVYPPDYEREMRARLGEFELATQQAGHAWHSCDLTTAFPEWMAAHPYREGYFERPDHIELVEDDLLDAMATRVEGVLAEAGPDAVVALSGIGTLFGHVFVSHLVGRVDEAIEGRLAVFFPGRHARNTYRLLDARDGWDYLAIPIKA